MTMQLFTGFEYLMIDVANQFGKDKLVFNDRIDWVKENWDHLEALTSDSDPKTRPLYIKAVMALRKAQQGVPTGHLVGFDSVCSGIQIMSAATGCFSGAMATGLVNPNVRADAYTELTTVMNTILADQNLAVHVTRASAKEAFMTSSYGSKAKPIEIFGEDTPELFAFYKAAETVAPGAWELLNDSLNTWQPYALFHEWMLPDGFLARVKVMKKKELRIEVDELDHATFTYQYYDNEGKETGLSNVANVVHSIDAYVLRSMHRRCNYDVGMVTRALTFINQKLDYRNGAELDLVNPDTSSKLASQVIYYKTSGITDPVVFPYITSSNTTYMPSSMLIDLQRIALMMLDHKPFELVTVHDEFKCHANNMNHVRKHYVEILAQIADSNILSDIMSQLHGSKGTYTKLSNNLSSYIRESNYALS